MTRSTSDTGLTQRTYPMSERSRAIIDQISIVTPGFTKTELVNVAVFWLATSIMEIRKGDAKGMKDAFATMQSKMAEYGFEAVRDAISNDMKITPLDHWFEREDK